MHEVLVPTLTESASASGRPVPPGRPPALLLVVVVVLRPTLTESASGRPVPPGTIPAGRPLTA